MTRDCQHTSCTDDAQPEPIHLEDGNQYCLCEDHKHMRIDGQPVEGYTPNDSEKFNA